MSKVMFNGNQVDVMTRSTYHLEEKTITENGIYLPSQGINGFSSVNVNVSSGITPSGSETFTENGTYDVTNIASAIINVASQGISLQDIDMDRIRMGTFTLTSEPKERTYIYYDRPYPMIAPVKTLRL